jgi:hypothetical protein
VAAALLLISAAITPLSAQAATMIHLQADRIDFYYDRYLVEANGHVRVTTSDGETITGDTFSMDLKLNRFLIASNVHLRSPGGSLDGAAISDFIDFNRIYFVPVISKPDRWTYENGDFEKPLKGRIMPGDVFYFPDLSRSHVSYSATSAIISAKQYVRFRDVHTLGGALPLPSFYVYFGTSQDLAQNSLSGANFDATWDATGSDHDISAIHVRYDSYNHAYLSFEQHLAGNDPHEYAVFSVNPMTKNDKYWNLVTGEHVGDKFQVTTFTQLYTNQVWLSQPSSSAQTTYVTMVQALPHSSITSFFNTTNYNLIGPSDLQGTLNHPNYDQTTWQSYNNRVFHLPLYFQYKFGLGYNHDAITALQVYGNTDYTTIWNHLFDYTFSLPGIKIGDRDRAYSLYYLNAVFDWQRQWYSVPHHVNTQNTTFSLSRQYSRFVNAYLAYSVANTSDLYNHGGYSPYIPPAPPGEQPDAAYAAFRGASTLRQTTLGITYSASPNLVTNIVAAHHDDFPAAYPNLFSPPPLRQYEYTNYLGQPPWQLTGEVRARILPHLVIDVARTYFFHFGTQGWNPEFVVQFSQ